MGVQDEIKIAKDDFSSKIGQFQAARSDLARIDSATLPADLQEEYADLVSSADWLLSPIQSAWSRIVAAYDYFFGSENLGLEPISTALAFAAVAGASALLVKFLADYASFKDKLALLKAGYTPGQVADLSNPPLFRVDKGFLILAGVAVAAVLWWKYGRRVG